MSSRPAATDPLRVPTAVVAVVALLACVLAVVAGVFWYRAAHDDALPFAVTRDDVAAAARQNAINLNTIDRDRIDEGYALWGESATGVLLAEYRENSAAYRQVLVEAGASTAARIRDSAVAEVDPNAGTARALVAVDVTYSYAEAEPQCARLRLILDLRRVDQDWKVEQLSPSGGVQPVPGACPAPAPVDDPN